MSSWFKDADFQRHLLSFICRDRNFLKTCGGLLKPKDFRPGRDETQERYIIATIALEFWATYRQPIGGMLRAEVADFVYKNNVEGEDKKLLYKLVEKINSGEKLVAVAAMEDRVVKYLGNKKIKDSIETLVSKYEEGELDKRTFVTICKEVTEWSGDTKRTITSYLDKGSLENRISRRSFDRKKTRPLIFIDEFDTKTKGPGRGDLGLILALYKMGKSLCLAHLADAYAKQKLNVLYITLEDPQEEVEDRMDAAMANMPIDKLNDLPNKLRKRFRKFAARISGRIRIVDATEDGISVDEVDEIWERQRDQGFTADVVIIDYDDEIKPPQQQKDRRHEFADIYRALRRFAAKRNVILWTAAQTQRIAENTKVITGRHASEDVSKVRKATVVIGIGQGEEHIDARYLYVAAHKRGRAKFGFTTMASPHKGIFYDRERTQKEIWAKKKGKVNV